LAGWENEKMGKDKEVVWDIVAKHFEFDSPQQMFNHWYINQSKNLDQIADIVEEKKSTIFKALIFFEIPVRVEDSKGIKGGLRLGIFACRYCHNSFHGDIRNVCCLSPECIAKHILIEKHDKNISASKHNDKKTKNTCKICGKDKGKNFNYCPSCHSQISHGLMFDC
jgi:hypothetical protein